MYFLGVLFSLPPSLYPISCNFFHSICPNHLNPPFLITKLTGSKPNNHSVHILPFCHRKPTWQRTNCQLFSFYKREGWTCTSDMLCAWDQSKTQIPLCMDKWMTPDWSENLRNVRLTTSEKAVLQCCMSDLFTYCQFYSFISILLLNKYTCTCDTFHVIKRRHQWSMTW